jgi:integrase
MALTDVKVRNAKPGDKQVKLSDSGGLYLLVSPPGKKTPNGGKCWRFKYRFGGKEKLLALGTYPEISLADARQRRDEARRQVAVGVDPGEVRKAQKAARAECNANSFEVIGREWFNKFSPNWADSHAEKIKARLENDIYPWLGKRPITEIKAPELLAVLRRIEARGALDTAHRAKCNCGQIFRYAIATGRAERDPSADLKGALPPAKGSHFPAITDPKEVAGLLRAIDGYEGTFPVRCALQLAPMLLVRPGELRKMEWTELDLELFDGSTPEWNIPGSRMKMKIPHTVPLPQQAVEILKALRPLTGNSRYVFPSVRSHARPMSENTVNAALRRLGYDSETMCGHGFRAMARTILDEVLQIRPDFIEHQLAHSVKDPLGRAYNRTTHLTERKKMMQTWADYLDKLKSGAKIIQFPAKLS